MKKSVTLIDNRNDNSYEFEILSPTIGPDVISIGDLYKKTGMFTYDPGYTSTASCSSKITYIDGEKGVLLYRGYNILDIATKKNYLEACFLLFNNRLANKEEYKEFDKKIRENYFVHNKINSIFLSFNNDAHPMAMLSSMITVLSTFHFQHLSANTREEFESMTMEIIAKIPTLVAMIYRQKNGLSIIQPDVKRYFTENFLYMLRAYPTGEVDIKDIEVKALDTIFTLHADHEQNASTSTARAVSSTGAHPYASFSASVSALWGALHGGANEKVINQINEIGSIDNVDAFIEKVKDKSNPTKLMGFGHRVYKNYDPRAKVLKELLHELKDELDIDIEQVKIAEKLEQIALSDDYFISKRLYPNVDFYSGIILTALRIPSEYFTTIFVIGRGIGWMTQLVESKLDSNNKIVRPRQRYIGEVDKNI